LERKQIKTRLIGILTSGQFGAIDGGRISEETSLLNELNFDSLQLLDLIVALETAFGFRANTERLRIDIFDRLGSVIDFVQTSLSPNVIDVGGVHAPRIG
jgi:acyl carrier protein